MCRKNEVNCTFIYKIQFKTRNVVRGKLFEVQHEIYQF